MTIETLKNWLNGKKTIIGMIAGAVYSALIYYSVVPSNEIVWVTLATYTGISFKLGINKLQPVDNSVPVTVNNTPAPIKYTPSGDTEPPEVLAG